jgi:NhaA family Na+:H+ antiporter
MARRSLVEKYLVSPVLEFIRDSRAVGITLICCTILSLVASNSSGSNEYLSFWNREILQSTGGLHLPHTILHFINDALMAVFFLMVGMEIKRELMIGELNSVRKSLLPVVAAVGGMVVPAFIYYLWCGGTPYSNGWGIPMATDIAFSLGVLSLLGNKAPLALRVFLTALAIIDDLGGILAIAIFYAGDLNWAYLGLGGLIFAILITLNLLKVQRNFIYFILGLLLWYFIFNSGVHATIAGVLLAFTIPLKNINKLIHSLHDPVNFLILPIFALANTAIAFPPDVLQVFTTGLHHGIFMGLVLGKPLGIFLFSYLAVKLKIGMMPTGLVWRHIIGMGMVAGIGFTISIFIATLALGDAEAQTIAKIAVIGASVISGLIGFLYLKLVHKKLSASHIIFQIFHRFFLHFFFQERSPTKKGTCKPKRLARPLIKIEVICMLHYFSIRENKVGFYSVHYFSACL